MTYCVGIRLRDGIVMASDSRTNAGVDDFAKFCKMTVFEQPGDRVLILLSSGTLAGTQAVISVLKQRSEAESQDGSPNLKTARTMFDVAVLVSDAVRDIERRDAPFLEDGPIPFNASFIVGGQIKGEPPRLFRIYAEGNFIEAGGIEATVDFARDKQCTGLDDDFRCEGANGPVEKRGQHLAGLVRVVVDRLLAEDDEARVLGADNGLQHLGDRQRLKATVGAHKNATIGAHREPSADRVGSGRLTNRYDHHLGGMAGFLHAQSFFDGDFVEGIHRHLDVGEVDAATVGLDPNLDVDIDDPLYGHQKISITTALGFRPFAPVVSLPAKVASLAAPWRTAAPPSAHEDYEDRADDQPSEVGPPSDLRVAAGESGIELEGNPEAEDILDA